MKDDESTYRTFVQFEERAAAIYLQLASRFSQDSQLSSFWLDMAMHEKQHAGLLQFCVCERLFAKDLPSRSEIDALAADFQRLEKRAADPNLTSSEAFALAVEMEASEINAIYSYLTTTVHNSMYLLRRKISTLVPDHVDELIAAAGKFGVAQDVLQKLNQSRDRCSERWQRPA
jgi:rubrerythrin